ncbi:MAG: hypothetical protein HY200_02010 [Nitrospirae bacterium]|nr:hypothetical protein [Nitrospirota bacterium]
MIKEILFGLSLFGLGFSPTVVQAQVSLDIHLGDQPVPSPPMINEPPPIELQAPPEMIYDEGLRVYIAIGIPHDLFFNNNFYYYYVNRNWYRSGYYRGPWVRTEMRRIPRGLREHRLEEIREHREHAFREYRGHEDRYRGRHFRAEEPRERHDRGKHSGENHNDKRHDGERHDREIR